LVINKNYTEMHGQRNIQQVKRMFMQILTREDGTEVVPKRRWGITTIRCVTSQKSAGLICFAVRVWNHALYILHLMKYI